MKQNITQYIKTWEKRCYFDGIPEETPPRISQMKKAPSYKDICTAILKNDNNLKSLGFTPKKSKYYSFFKKIEIDARESTKVIQLKLF